MAAPTPETLRVFEMFDEEAGEQTILQYINNNQARIDVTYNRPEQGSLLSQSVIVQYSKIMKRLLDLGAIVDNNIVNAFFEMHYSFEPPVAPAKELMIELLDSGFPKEKMLHILTMEISGTHKELLKRLLEQPLDINYKYNDITALHGLIEVFAHEETDEFRGVFMDMLRALIQKGANPNEVDDQGITAVQFVNQRLNRRNPGPILNILRAAAPAAPAPAAPAVNYRKLWTDELKKPSPDIAKLEEYKNAGAIDVNADIDAAYNPLSLRISRKPDMKLLETLLKWGATPNIVKYDYPIFWNIFNRSIKDMKQLLLLMIKYGADVKIIAYNKTSLMVFIEKSLIEKDDPEFTQKHKEIADILIEKGVDIHYRNRRGDVLDTFISTHNADAIRYFIGKGMSIIVDGRTRLYFYITNLANLPQIAGFQISMLILKLDRMLKHHSNVNDYFRDFLDAGITNPKLTVLHILQNVYTHLENKFNPNEVYVDGSTPLIKAVQLYTTAPQPWVKTMIESMVEKGANISYTDSTGKKAIDYATDEEIKELLGEKNFKILWTGFSRADIDFTNMIFKQTTHASNLAIINPDESLFSICPVCLKYIQHETGTCMYMTHSCVEQAGYNGYYHKKLWNTFSYEKELYNARGEPIPGASKRVLEWCTNCGRICKEHQHYEISPIYKSGSKDIIVPHLVGYGDFFATSCDKPEIGGGGIKEKLKRYRRFREVVLGLNDPSIIGHMPYEEVINILVENVWEAPLENRRFEMSKINRLEKDKKYNYAVANNRFPLPSELPPPPRYVYSDPAYPDAGNPDLLPLVYSTATNTMKNSAYGVFGDNDNIVQFRHRMANGTINKHAGPNQQVALDRLIGFISLMNESPASDDFGMCWQHAKDAYDNVEMLDDKTHKPPKCTAKLYPDEVFHAIQSAAYADEGTKQHHVGVYTYYKKLFGEKFGKPIGLAPNSNVSNSKNNNNQEGGRRTRKQRQRKCRTLCNKRK